MRLIDADALNYVRVRIYHDDETIGGYTAIVPSSEIKNAPTVDAIPVEWIEQRIREIEVHPLYSNMERDAIIFELNAFLYWVIDEAERKEE